MVQNSLGSGVIVSAEGHIITNNHVVDQVDEIEVQLSDGRTKKARLVGADAAVDLAVLKIDEPGLKPLKFGDSDAVQAGDFVLAIGNPFGFEETVTDGIISSKGRPESGRWLRRLSANQRRDQSREQRRPAGESARRDHRDQYRDHFEERRIAGDRLCHSFEFRPDRAGELAEKRTHHPRISRHSVAATSAPGAKETDGVVVDDVVPEFAGGRSADEEGRRDPEVQWPRREEHSTNCGLWFPRSN